MTTGLEQAMQTAQEEPAPEQTSGSAGKTVQKPSVSIICVVPGCTTDVSTGPHYLKRHKLCSVHLKAQEVFIDGRAVRFCQQCGRFQPISDFKDSQRSCEAALQAHNARRRVKKDAHGNTWSSERRGRGAKRALAAATAADDPSSSEDGAVGASRKSAAPRKSSSQRSAPSALQQSAGSDSLKGSEGNERPLSDGARTVEQNAWTSHASPDNSYGSPEGFEQQQQQQVQMQPMQVPGVMLGGCCAGPSNSAGSPAGADQSSAQLAHLLQQQLDGYGQPGMQGNLGANGLLAAGRSRLGLQSAGSGNTGLGMPNGCGVFAGLMQPTPQELGMGSMPALSQAQQLMSGPTLSCNPSTGLGGNPGFGPAATLEAWMMPQGVMQQQQAQLQQYWSPNGTGTGLEEAMGQSLMLQQAMQEQQLMMLSQPQLHQQQMQPQGNHILPAQLPPQPQLKQEHKQLQQLQQANGLRQSSFKNSKGSGTESSGTVVAGQDASGTGSAEPSASSPRASGPAGSGKGARLPATSAAAAAALANDSLFDFLPSHGANSSSSLSLLDGINTSVQAAPAAAVAADAGPSGTDNHALDEDALLDQALDVLLASGPDWQMDEVLLGPQAAAMRSHGTNSALVPPATTSSPSSSNMNGGNNLSGPLSVPSLPSAGQSMGLGQMSAQQAACGMAAATAGLVSATDALQVGSPGNGPGAAVMPAAGNGMLATAAVGGGMGASVGLDDLLPPVHFTAGTATGMDVSAAIPAAGASMASMAAGVGAAGVMGAGAGMLPAGGAMQMCSMGGVSTGSMFPGNAAGMLGAGAGMASGGAFGFGAGMGAAPHAGGSMPCGIATAPGMGSMAVGGMAVGAGGVAVGVSSTLPMTQTASAMGMQQGAGNFSQLDQVFTGLPGPNIQAIWQQQQQQQQQQESLLLQQQLMMQQQQQAEYLLLQQQQQMQRRQQLMRLQQQINSTMTYSQQLVRLSVKLHGVTPDQLPASTVLAMERLLVNNAADIEMILLQPSLRQGCIQFELDLLIKCPRLHKPEDSSPAHTVTAAGDASTGSATAAEPATAGSAQASDSEDFEFGSGSKWYMGSRMPAIVAALTSDAATQLAEARLRAALPFGDLVEALLDLPLVTAAADDASDTASEASSEDFPRSSSDGGSDRCSSGSAHSACNTVRSYAQAIYAQLGSSMGIWRVDQGLVQGWDTELSPELTFGAGAVDGNWRPVIKSCMPLVGAVAESSTASSPTAAAAEGQAHLLKPLPLRLELQAAPGTSGPGADSASLQLWCTRRGQFLPLATRAASAGASPAHFGSSGGLLDLQVVAGLLDSTPGLLLLQAEHQVRVQLADSDHVSTAQDDLPAEAQDMGCMSSLVPVLLCPSAAMAAECNVHLCMMEDVARVAPKMLELGLVLDFWALHMQVQQQQLDGSPRSEWQEALLSNRRYLKVIKSMGTCLLLTAVVSGMSATSAHLHGIMSVVRDLLKVAEDAGPAAADTSAAPDAAIAAASAMQAEAAGAGAPAAAAAQQQAAAEDADAAAVEPQQALQSPSSMHEEGSSAAAAAGLKPVEEWVFEDVDCKGANMPDCHSGGSSCNMADAGDLSKPEGKPSSAAAGSAGADAAAVDGDGQQSPYMIFRGAAQMLAMLLLMYLLLEVASAVYKGRSPAQQLLTSLLQLEDLLGIMLVPLAMMCLGGVLAVWQFGVTGAAQQQEEQRQRQQQHASLSGGTVGGKGAGKDADLRPESVAYS